MSYTANWLMEPQQMRTMFDRARLIGWPTQADINTARRNAAKRLSKASGKIAVLHIHGIIEQRVSAYSWLFGGVGADDLGRAIDSLVANRDVHTIVLEWDSPGGTRPGIEELSNKIFNHRGTKQIVSIVNSCMCSAAYWAGSAADQIVATPGSEAIGSIGVYTVHIDESKALETEGLKVTFIHAGKYKVEGNAAEPLSEETKAHWQSLVDSDYSSFIGAVARNRGVKASEIRSGYGDGRYFTAGQAKDLGMVDAVMSMDELMAKLGGGIKAQSGRDTKLLRLRQAQRIRAAGVVHA